MLKTSLTGILFFLCTASYAQSQIERLYEPSSKHPFGQVHPDYVQGLAAFAPMIGQCECKSLRRAPDRTWGDTARLFWEYRYVLNGTAIQDVSWSENKVYAGSIRQYNLDSAQWYVTNFTSRSITGNPRTWRGGLGKNGEIVLLNEQQAGNGLDGFYKITFKDIKEEGFNWLGEWVDKAGTISFPTWRMWCKKLGR